MSDDVKRIERELTNELKRRGVDISPTLRREVRACASDQMMVESARQMLHDGAVVDFDQYTRLRSAAEESRIKLLGETARVGPSRIEVEFVAPPEAYIKLKEECAALRLQVEALEACIKATAPAAASDGAPGILPPSAASPSAAPPSPPAPPPETPEQRRARALASAPVVSAPLESRYRDIYNANPDMVGRTAYTRFDNLTR